MKVSKPLILVFAVAFGLSLIFNTATWLVSGRIFDNDNTTAVLHYSADFGIDFIGDSSQVTVLPKIGAILLAFNLLVGAGIFRAEPRAAWIFWIINPFLQAGLLGALTLIWRINQ